MGLEYLLPVGVPCRPGRVGGLLRGCGGPSPRPCSVIPLQSASLSEKHLGKAYDRLMMVNYIPIHNFIQNDGIVITILFSWTVYGTRGKSKAVSFLALTSNEKENKVILYLLFKSNI